MTDEKMLELARIAGAVYVDLDDYWDFTPEQLRKFAALVRREALEEAAKICEEISGHFFATEYDWPYVQCADAIRALAEQEGDK